MNRRLPALDRHQQTANFAMATGLLLALSMGPPNLGFLAWFALVPLGVVLRSGSMSKHSWAAVYLGGLILHLWALDWMRTLYGGVGFLGNYAPGWLVAGQLGSLLFCLMVLAGRRLVLSAKLPVALTIPLVWMGYEYLQYWVSIVFGSQGTRMLSLAYTQADYPLVAQIADLGGEGLICLVVAAANGCLYDCGSWLLKNRPLGIRRSVVLRLLPIPCILGCVLSYGYYRLSQLPTGQGPTVCLMTRRDLPPLLEQSRIPLADAAKETSLSDQPTLLVWPELAYHHAILPESNSDQAVRQLAESWPLARGDAESYSRKVKRYLEDAAEQLNVGLLIGCERLEAAGGAVKKFNSLAFTDAEQGFVGTYDKLNLAPFTEFAPTLWSWLRVANRFDYQSGESARTFAVSNLHGDHYTFGCSLCYDVAFAEHFRQQLQAGPIDFFVAACSEASDKTGRLSQLMLRMTRLRAIETRCPIVRNAHMGYSGIIDASGRLHTVSNRGELAEPHLLGSVPLDGRRSLYASWGDLVTPACFLLLLGALLKPWLGAMVAGVQSYRKRRRPFSLPGRLRRVGRGGFSLLELLAVVAIIGTLAGIILPRVTNSSQTVKEKADAMNIAMLNSAVERWYVEKGTWPANNLSDIGGDDTYFPEGIPTSPLNGNAYRLDPATHRITTSGGGGK